MYNSIVVRRLACHEIRLKNKKSYNNNWPFDKLVATYTISVHREHLYFMHFEWACVGQRKPTGNGFHMQCENITLNCILPAKLNNYVLIFRRLMPVEPICVNVCVRPHETQKRNKTETERLDRRRWWWVQVVVETAGRQYGGNIIPNGYFAILNTKFGLATKIQFMALRVSALTFYANDTRQFMSKKLFRHINKYSPREFYAFTLSM